ncbi:protein kinase domain containing protein [Entamoeba histolytica HM-1:IMSS-B]|uniref:Protein kinase domain containing protein n=6 Tax=Entamoeba histolytica TaxID=5759 RepID=C4LU78_ENTH1|nr:protein kinase domain containing protein [Entamoeba histolytica HM-1:IMSS]EMD46406.1 serine/threonine protein kinase, putative [Entamoeba histolytica KU27]EMH75882.1 protein kinase domain containing protein [Entamoeba histolytica HM-1:IMSS-B]EMS16613.1 serine-threonine protein kinase, putative [Entamoeba histolytica HM-3:IMSS]ENY62688.1 serine-threonine protein kinase, putative [Entamoeba histolytica HM-1:IMSS-A]GAT92151.1 protein kinase domain containing protein [Entamoeba histolytica]|eukprot:XP_657034.1 protein kinase domain containing protein [Entamoeba histolytica HM-1:IMSS]
MLFFTLIFCFIFGVFGDKDHLDVCGVGCPTCRPDGSCMSQCFGGFNSEDGCSSCAKGYINYPYCTALCGNFVIDEGEECDGGEGCTEECTCDRSKNYEYSNSKCIKDTYTSELTMDIITAVLFAFCILCVLLYAAYLTYAKKYRLLREDATSNTSNISTHTSSSSSDEKGKKSGNTGTPPSIDLLTKSDHSTTSSMTDTDTNTSTDTSSDNTDRSTKRRRRAIFRQRGDVYTKIPERRYFSSTPSFPLELSKNTLLFGGSFEKLKVRVPYTDEFSIVNMRNSPWNFSVKEIKNPKYEILLDPIEGTIAPGTQVNIIAQIKLKCSCRVNAELLVTIRHQEKMYTSNIDVRAEAQESEYIDGDEFDLENATPSEINIGQCYSLMWKQKQIFIKTFTKAENPDIQLRSEIKFLQILNEQQLASKYYGKAISHKLSCIVLEYYPLGTIDHFLDQQVISPKLKRKMLTEIVTAISMLHSFHFIYRQLNPSSILVASTKLSQGPHIKLCGCSQIIKADAQGAVKFDQKGKYNYFTDPIAFNSSMKADYPMDIFSLAHVFVMMYYGEQITDTFKVTPHELSQMQSTNDRIFDMNEIPNGMNHEFAQLVCDLWNSDRVERPSIAELAKKVKTIPLTQTTQN